MNANRKNAIERLRELANGAAPESTFAGLCYEMKKYGIQVSILALGWDKHSGSECYPIPATSSPDFSASKEYTGSGDLWGGEQGKLRRDLCTYIADKLAGRAGKL